VKPSLVAHLRCPSCGNRLAARPVRSSSGEVLAGWLLCRRRHRFPIRKGVPRFADPLRQRGEQARTGRSFSAKWSRIPGYGHDRRTRDFQIRWYLERFGWKTRRRLARFLGTRRRILEAGTGTGPLLEQYARHGAGEVFGLDLSPAIDSVYRHLNHWPGLHLVQADLRKAPFPRRYFDFIVSDQVLHHTPDTRASFKKLVRNLAPGGQIAAYVYVRKGPVREFCDDYLRERTVDMSARECYRFSRAVTHLGKALTHLEREIDLPEPIPLLDIPAGRHDVQRWVYWHVLKCFYNKDFDFETNVMVNFDWYHPLNASRHTPGEVKSWVRECGLRLVHLDVSPSGISFRAQKSA
jgi:SAM-dependent methyltransferase